MTADFEAIIEPNGNNYIYMAAWYNGSNSRIFDIKPFSNQKEFLTAFWSDLIANNKERTCYFHNWGGYDSILSLPYLLNFNSNLTFKPTVKDGELMALDIYEGRSHLFSIKDSIRILPGSLAKLAKDYKVPTQKEHFPHYFFLNNIQETLSYVGEIPSYRCFESKRTSEVEYKEMEQEYTNKQWSFMEVSRQYIMGDCMALYQILVSFYFTLC